MEAIIECAAGLDMHQGSVMACVIPGALGRRSSKEVRSFGTIRKDLAVLREWLLEKDAAFRTWREVAGVASAV